jgi:hypothetical protein
VAGQINLGAADHGTFGQFEPSSRFPRSAYCRAATTSPSPTNPGDTPEFRVVDRELVDLLLLHLLPVRVHQTLRSGASITLHTQSRLRP